MIVMIMIITRISTIMTWPMIAMATVQPTIVITLLLVASITVLIITYFSCD